MTILETVFENQVSMITVYDGKHNGPVLVELDYPEDYEGFDEIQEKLPITQRQYVNPESGDLVGYGRAKQLGII